ncbi:MAG: hypothetical protein ABIO76_03415 [Ginsengibacter sp.]
MLREWKELVRKKAIAKIGPESYREQQHNNPLEITGQQMFDEKLLYIHQNPVQSEFVTSEEDWKYSSASEFCGMKGLVFLNYS